MQTIFTIAPVLTSFPPAGFVANDLSSGTACDDIKRVAAFFAQEPVAQASHDALFSVGGMCLDSCFGALNVIGGVCAFRNCLNDGFISLNGAMLAAYGLNAAACLDRVVDAAVQLGIGIGSYGIVTSGLVAGGQFVVRLRQGDLMGAALSGSKLVTILALTGHPVVLGIVIAVDLAYSCSHWVLPAAAAPILPSQDAMEQLPLLANS